MSMIIDDICTYAPKSGIKAGEATKDGQYMFFTSSEDESKRYTDYLYDGEGIIMGTGGNATLHYYHGKYAVSTDCIVLIPDDRIRCKYLYYFFLANMPLLEAGFKGAGLKHTNKKYIGNITIPEIPPLDEQDRIIEVLDKIFGIINARNHEIAALDVLVKARFVELFGDPLSGSEKWPIHTVGDVANSVDPQPSHRTPPIDESGIPYVSIKDCDYKTGKIDFENARKVGRSVLDEHLQRYELHDGDFIIGKIGTIGNPIFIPARKDYTLSANIVLIQPDRKKVSPYFLKYSFMSAYMDRQFEEAKNSTSQAAFGIQKVRAIKVMNPSLDVQYQFEAFAKQVDKSKVSVQKALDEAQVLFNSLMQQYFG